MVITLLGFGFLLGIQHAFDSDHIVAITTMAAEQKSIKKSSLLGVFWGFGHTFSLLVVGVALLALKISIPERVALSLESVVGGMLVFLGVRLLLKIRREKIHIHAHAHDGSEHVHFHSHAAAEDHRHAHRSMKQSLVVGAVHGLAGSGALTLLVLATIPSIGLGIFYIAVFGLGSVLGMALVSSLISLPLALIPKRVTGVRQWISSAAGMMAIVFGLRLIYTTVSSL